MKQGQQSLGNSNLLQPFMFVLKEGKDFKSDLLDYSLLMLQIGRAEILKAPSKSI